MIETFLAVVAALLFVFAALPWLLAGGGGALFAGLFRALCAVGLFLFVIYAGMGG